MALYSDDGCYIDTDSACGQSGSQQCAPGQCCPSHTSCVDSKSFDYTANSYVRCNVDGALSPGETGTPLRQSSQMTSHSHSHSHIHSPEHSAHAAEYYGLADSSASTTHQATSNSVTFTSELPTEPSPTSAPLTLTNSTTIETSNVISKTTLQAATSSQSTVNSNPTGRGAHLGIGALAGIVVGAIVVAAVGLVGASIWYRSYMRREKSMRTTATATAAIPVSHPQELPGNHQVFEAPGGTWPASAIHGWMHTPSSES
jgi:hypothetical protein